ncbi:hypothetical protein PV04_02031 [Phialophora macrospora]|uniref:RRM domain-containing protein n=1 Tax=Phialophora macrospora TaxID=1851006 RepID=A0A0D2EHY7_9EURO|nr:hypothetical protein PV04_02031 [Phialophora macrospora]
MPKKRKHEQLQDQDDLPITKPPQPEEPSQTEAWTVPAKSKGQLKQEKSERRAKKQKKSKEEAKEQDQSTSHAADVPLLAPVAAEDAPAQGSEEEMKKKKSKKSKKKAKNESDEGDKSAPARFICFVGNLPYDATLDQINAHFSKIAPTSVRHATEKATGKSKGYAFLEFDHYDKMKTCLKLYHHSIFDPEARGRGKDAVDAQEDDKEQTNGKQKKGRRLNVELTAGGGGKSKARKAKISSKNQKLEEERVRRRLKEKAEREKSAPKQKPPPETGANAVEVKDTRGAIHPSRLSRVSH